MRTVPIFLLLCSPALAHDTGHPELNEWFNRLQSGRGLCCSFADGSAVSDVDWESLDGHYRVRLENNWIDVPDEALITEPNRAGRTMVWPSRDDGKILSGASCRAAWASAFVGRHMPTRKANMHWRHKSTAASLSWINLCEAMSALGVRRAKAALSSG